MDNPIATDTQTTDTPTFPQQHGGQEHSLPVHQQHGGQDEDFQQHGGQEAVHQPHGSQEDAHQQSLLQDPAIPSNLNETTPSPSTRRETPARMKHLPQHLREEWIFTETQKELPKQQITDAAHTFMQACLEVLQFNLSQTSIRGGGITST
jgi:hypothetical protein